MGKIADQYVADLTPLEAAACRAKFEADGYREVWWSSEAYGDGLHITWYGSRLRCTCEMYGECARCDPQRAAGRWLG